jgi:hypothetical protein
MEIAMSPGIGMSEIEELSERYLARYRSMHTDAARLESTGRLDNRDAEPHILQLHRTLTEFSHHQALELTELAQRNPSEELAAAFRTTALHRKVQLQSAFIRRALDKPRGYAGDMELMLMICKHRDVGRSLFARLLNRVYLELPASEAVRQRVRLLADVLRDLPDGARVLNLACGPALEVQRALKAGHRDVHFDLVDHDSLALSYLDSRMPSGNRRLLQGNAFHPMAGDRRVQHFSDGNAERADRYDFPRALSFYTSWMSGGRAAGLTARGHRARQYGLPAPAGADAATADPAVSYYLSLGDSLAQCVQPLPAPEGPNTITDQGYPDQLTATLRAANPALRLVKLGCRAKRPARCSTGAVRAPLFMRRAASSGMRCSSCELTAVTSQMSRSTSAAMTC